MAKGKGKTPEADSPEGGPARGTRSRGGPVAPIPPADQEVGRPPRSRDRSTEVEEVDGGNSEDEEQDRAIADPIPSFSHPSRRSPDAGDGTNTSTFEEQISSNNMQDPPPGIDRRSLQRQWLAAEESEAGLDEEPPLPQLREHPDLHLSAKVLHNLNRLLESDSSRNARLDQMWERLVELEKTVHSFERNLRDDLEEYKRKLTREVQEVAVGIATFAEQVGGNLSDVERNVFALCENRDAQRHTLERMDREIAELGGRGVEPRREEASRFSQPSQPRGPFPIAGEPTPRDPSPSSPLAAATMRRSASPASPLRLPWLCRLLRGRGSRGSRRPRLESEIT